jgi:multidrug efflux system outer membrane protein
MGPDFLRPEIGIQTPESFQHAPGEKESSKLEDQWWHVFNNPELNQVVDQALKNNLDIQKATAGILAVRSLLVQTRAERFPSLGFKGDAQRQKRPIIGIIPGQSFTVRSDVHTLSLPASFELDLWGRLARAEEAARADLLRAEESRQTLAQSVVAETVSLYLQMESYERRIQIAEENIKSFRRSVDLVRSRYERGLSSILDLKQARRILAQAETVLPTLRQELGITQQRMAVLMGTYPESRPPRGQPEDYFKLLAPVPPGLPSELLLRRPDIIAAEAGLKALNARVGVAKASRFPKISLTGNFGYTSEELDRLIHPESELWSMAAGLSQPLFDAGRLKAGQRAAEARYQQGIAEYAKTVLTAFSEVEKALLTRKEQLERRDRVLVFLAEARAVQEVAETRYERGLVDYLTVLDSQRTRFQAEDSLVLVDLAILTNRVSLHRALGTGWAEMRDAPHE